MYQTFTFRSRSTFPHNMYISTNTKCKRVNIYRTRASLSNFNERMGVFQIHPHFPVTLDDARDARDLALSLSHKVHCAYEIFACNQENVEKYLDIVEELEMLYKQSIHIPMRRIMETHVSQHAAHLTHPEIAHLKNYGDQKTNVFLWFTKPE